MRFSQIKGVGVGLASQSLFHTQLKRYGGFMLRFKEWAIFKAYVLSLYVDSSHGNPR